MASSHPRKICMLNIQVQPIIILSQYSDDIFSLSYGFLLWLLIRLLLVPVRFPFVMDWFLSSGCLEDLFIFGLLPVHHTVSRCGFRKVLESPQPCPLQISHLLGRISSFLTGLGCTVDLLILPSTFQPLFHTSHLFCCLCHILGNFFRSIFQFIIYPFSCIHSA